MTAPEESKTSPDTIAASASKKKAKKAAKRTPKRKRPEKNKNGKSVSFPRYSVKKALRIPSAIIEQNAGKACTDKESAKYCGVSYHGPFGVEIGSAIKYGLLDRPTQGKIQPTDLAKKILRPKTPTEELEGIREAILNAPTISDVYKHYRGENIPDDQFLRNALTDTFGISSEKVEEFKTVFLEDLNEGQLIEDVSGKKRVVDVSQGIKSSSAGEETLKKIAKGVKIEQGDSCFVMMPFADPLGPYYKLIYEPAIIKAGLKPVRADDEIFATGKIIDQVWTGINSAKVLVAELTSRNPNVFYELGLAHALQKPVVLVSSNQNDVPFDLQHIRVIYYDHKDPFWGEKLIAKVAENILSAIKNPEEAVFKKPI